MHVIAVIGRIPKKTWLSGTANRVTAVTASAARAIVTRRRPQGLHRTSSQFSTVTYSSARDGGSCL